MSQAELRLGEATALGLLHGPAELLPISSSGHVILVPWLLGWRYAGLDPALRKAFEVALHAGTALGLAVAVRDDLAAAARDLDRRAVALAALSCLPAAVAGLALERPIERRLGTPATVAAGLLAGSAALALADRRGPARRGARDAGLRDALAIGAAQAVALAPGVSRNGATLAAARARGFDRRAAQELSLRAGLPVIAGASALKGARLARRGLPREARRGFAAGIAASFASTLASTSLIRRAAGHSLAPYAVYRSALAGVVIRRLWQDRARAGAARRPPAP